MWRFTPYVVKFGPFDGRLFIILLVAILVMPVIGPSVAFGISGVSLISFWLVEKFGFDVSMVLRWLRCRLAGNYHTSAGARFDQPRKRWGTLYIMVGLMLLGGHYPYPALADFVVTDKAIGDKVAGLNKIPLKPGEPGENVVFVDAPCKNKIGIIDLDESPRKIERVTKQGNAIPLRIALKAILPRGWHADKAFDVNNDLLLSWSKGEEFTTVLFNLAHEHNLSIQINWKKKKISVFAGCVKRLDSQDSTALNDGSFNKDKPASLLSTKATPVPSPIPPKPPKPSAYYMLRTGQQLSDVLRAWCVMANQAEPSGMPWTVKWESAKNQTIEADSFYGNHIEEAIDKLQLTIFGNNLPFRVVKWPNHVIKVTN